MKMRRVGLPYVDNARAVLITLAVNLGVVFLFNRQGIAYRGALWDSFFCAIITTAIDMWIVHASLKGRRASGEMPSQVPVSVFMQRLPQNPFTLGAICAIGFGVITVGFNALILSFFGIQSMTFVPWMLYKLIYATVLSVKITEWCIFRYVQPDWAKGGIGKTSSVEPVKNPLPTVGVFKEMYAAVTGNIAMNILLGSALGGVRVGAGESVVIAPTTVDGIPITGLVFGLLVGILVTRGIVGEVNAAILASNPEVPDTAGPDRRFAWMPLRKAALTAFVCVCVMIFSAVVLPAVMRLFGLTIMNFYQFTVFITVYATLVGKPLSAVLIRRCMQPDYVRYVLKKAKMEVQV